MATKTTLYPVGAKVLYGRKNGEQTLGEIVGVTKKKYTIKQLEPRGKQKAHKVGTIWKVPHSMVTLKSIPLTEMNEFFSPDAAKAKKPEPVVPNAETIVGSTVVEIRPMTKAEMRDEGWTHPATVLVLSNGAVLYPACDPEGNDAGALFGRRKGRTFIL